MRRIAAALFFALAPWPALATSAIATDYSVNPATIPCSGCAASPLITIPVDRARTSVEVQNQSATTVEVVVDDGNGANQTIIILAAASVAGGSGGAWECRGNGGRVRVYAPTGAQVAAYTVD